MELEKELEEIRALLDTLLQTGQQVQSPWLTTQMAAEYLRCSRSKVEQLTARGQLPYRRLDPTSPRSPRLYHRRDLAAYLMARITRGASFMVGAVPGGAGKTTVMCALLNLVPADVELVAATPEAVAEAGRPSTGSRRCFVCHEIGRGAYFAYLWGKSLQRYCCLGDAGHLLATNLHADDIDETRNQVCAQNDVPQAHFNHFNLLLFLRIEGNVWHGIRRIARVYDRDGLGEHRLVYDLASEPTPRRLAASLRTLDREYVQACREFLSDALHARIRTIEHSRGEVLRFLGEFV